MVVEGNCYFLIYIQSRHLPGGTEENEETIVQASLFLGRDLNLGLHEYEAGIITLRSPFVKKSWSDTSAPIYVCRILLVTYTIGEMFRKCNYFEKKCKT
jgi:hypothetical protein